MPKLYYSVFFLVIGVITAVGFLITTRRKTTMHRAVSRLTGTSFLVAGTYFFTLISNSYKGMSVAYGFYFSCMDWFCFAVLCFVITFSGSSWHIRHTRAVLVVLTLDSLSMLINIGSNHAVDYTAVFTNRSLYFQMIPKWPFGVHLAICYAMIAAAVAILIRKIICSPQFYKYKYATVLALITAMVLLNACFLFTDLGVDISVAIYGIAAVILAYHTLRTAPRRLTTRLAQLVLNTWSYAVIFFDMNGDVIYSNKKGDRFGADREKTRDAICARLGLTLPNVNHDFSTELNVGHNGRTLVAAMEYRVLTENSAGGVSHLGSYLTINDITTAREKLLKREFEASRDRLTGLYNRAYFCEYAPKLLRQYKNVPYSVMVTNLHQFKLYNEVFGTEAGDKLLAAVAGLIKRRLNDSRILACRYEMDRFAFCLPTAFCTEDTFVNNGLFEPVQFERFTLINYIGVCEVDDITAPIQLYYERAAIALNTVKGDAAIRLAFYTKQMRDTLLREQQLSSSLENALACGEIVMYIQPQIDQTNSSIVGGEVLARWITRTGAVIAPGEFIPILEKTGQVTQLDLYIWEQACKLIRDMHERNLPISLSVNISAQDFYRCDICDTFNGLVKKHGIDPKCLKLEITESEIMSNQDENIRLLRRLQESGFVIEMDNFGSGYSSLNTLKDIPVDVLKIDMCFLKNTKHIVRGQIIIKNIASLAHDLELPIIAEGVEFVEQADFLRSVKCRYIQGYLYGRPMPVDDFIKLREASDYSELL